MIIPIVIPIIEDEHINGWIERLAAVNHIPLELFIKKYLDIPYALTERRSGCLKYVGGISRIVSHPSLSGIDLKDILVKHTTGPVDTLFMDIFSGIVYIDGMFTNPFYFEKIKNIGLKNLTPKGPRFCPMCVENDMRTHGYPIIHVPHQYSSVTACWKHGIELTGSYNDMECRPAAAEEIKLAIFLKSLYDMGPLENITSLHSACFKSPIRNKLKLLKGSDTFPDIISFSGMKSEQDFQKAFFPSALNSSKRDNLIRALSQIITADDLVSSLEPESVNAKISRCKEALQGTGGELCHVKYPFVVVRCGKCKRTHMTHYHEALIGPECPFCAKTLPNGNIKKRFIERILKRDGFIYTGNSNKNFKEMKHLCGKCIYVKPGRILEQGSLLCPDCHTIHYDGYSRRRFFKEINVIGTRRTMGCGLEAEIIAYRNSNDIDIRFDDGTVRKHVAYSKFNAGHVQPASRHDYADLRVGEKRTMNCGLEAEIIAYRNSTEIDVRFEDGTVRRNVDYYSFKNGYTQPILPYEYVSLRVGEKRTMNCGLEAEIISYRSANDIDVRFEDETIRNHTDYDHFIRGVIQPVSKRNYAVLRVGEKRTMNCGLEAEIIAYRKYKDMDVRFEDGTVRTNVDYNSFKNGYTKPMLPYEYAGLRVGEKRTMNCGLEAEIIAYRNSNDIDIRFDDGTVRKHVAYSKFNAGHVQPASRHDYANVRIGEKRTMNCGLEAEIIAYRNYNDIDVRFEDGTVRTNVIYDAFKKGYTQPILPNEYASLRIGEKRKMNCGLEAEIIAYRGANDIDVRFEDGTVRKHIAYCSFKEGSVNIVSLHNYAGLRVGEKRKMNCGLEAEIIVYRNSTDIDVRFEDGTVRVHKKYEHFKNGNILPGPKAHKVTN